MTCEFFAQIIKVCSFFGISRNGTLLGSTNDRSRRQSGALAATMLAVDQQDRIRADRSKGGQQPSHDQRPILIGDVDELPQLRDVAILYMPDCYT